MSILLNPVVARTYDFVIKAHGDQKREYTGAPYHTHCLAVADKVASVGLPQFVQQAALLHDVIEGTEITKLQLSKQFGDTIANLVAEVTDVACLKDGNRRKRKQIELEHLAKSSGLGASIKLADLIDNTISIVKYDPKFAKVYLEEKSRLLSVLQHGDKCLWHEAAVAVRSGQMHLRNIGVL